MVEVKCKLNSNIVLADFRQVNLSLRGHFHNVYMTMGGRHDSLAMGSYWTQKHDRIFVDAGIPDFSIFWEFCDLSTCHVMRPPGDTVAQCCILFTRSDKPRTLLLLWESLSSFCGELLAKTWVNLRLTLFDPDT